MDLWNELLLEESEGVFGSKQILLNTGERHHSSINRYLERSLELLPNSFIKKSYSYESRYIRIPNLVFDLLITIFDVNTSYAIILRKSKPLLNKTALAIDSFLLPFSINVFPVVLLFFAFVTLFTVDLFLLLF